MDHAPDVQQRTLLELRKSYGPFAKWVLRLDGFLEPKLSANPARTDVPSQLVEPAPKAD